MSTTDHSHRDDFNLTDVEVADAVDVAPPIIPPVIINAQAAQAATAQRAAAAAASAADKEPQAPVPRSFTDDLPPPSRPAREYTLGGGAGDSAASSSSPPPSSADDDDAAAPSRALDAGDASRGPPAPFAVDVGTEVSWAAREQLHADVLADDSAPAADWLASHYVETVTLDDGEDSWSSWRP